jgi:hypothetical protein
MFIDVSTPLPHPEPCHRLVCHASTVRERGGDRERENGALTPWVTEKASQNKIRKQEDGEKEKGKGKEK